MSARAATRLLVLAVLAVALAGVLHLRSERRSAVAAAQPAVGTAAADPAGRDRPDPDPAGSPATAPAASPSAAGAPDAAALPPVPPPPEGASPDGPALPRLLDLGADKCVPCRMMAPILAELRRDYEGRFDVRFIDVWKDRPRAAQYGIRLIPTQIFYDADGRELTRHQGFLSRADILRTWRELGFDFGTDPGGR